MPTAQIGIFAIGTASHCFLEFAARPGIGPAELAAAIANIGEPRGTVGGVNIVVGLRPSLWAEVCPGGVPAGAQDFATPLVGPDGFTMPATQQDAWVWVAGAAPDLVFDVAGDIITGLEKLTELATEVTGWSYRHSRDLIGFEDGTENPALADAPAVCIVPAGDPGEGASVLLVQQWEHQAAQWNALEVVEQEQVVGRTKDGSVELDDDVQLPTAHVARTAIEDDDGEELEIFRRNVPYGSISNYGTMFVGFTRDPARMQTMIERMAGVGDGIRDALTRYTTPLTGAYYVVPSIEALRTFATPVAD